MVGDLATTLGFVCAGFAETALLPRLSDGIGKWSSLVDTALPVYSSVALDATLSLCPWTNLARLIVIILLREDAAPLNGELEGEAQFGVVEVVAEQGAGAGEAIDQGITVQVEDLLGAGDVAIAGEEGV